MKNLRLWIAMLALVSAGAGFAGGLLVYGSLHEPPAPQGPFADYERRMIAEFDLSPERARLFRTVLESYKRERDGLRELYEAELMSLMAPELGNLDARYRDLIRNSVIPPAARPDYDRLALGGPLPGRR